MEWGYHILLLHEKFIQNYYTFLSIHIIEKIIKQSEALNARICEDM